MGWRDRAESVDAGSPTPGWRARAEPVPGEAGAPAPDIYALGPNALQPTGDVELPGTMRDAAISWADTAGLGAGPQISGAIGALANSATQVFRDKPGGDLEAYREVRDESGRRIEQAEKTGAGQAIKPLAMISTPIPVKSLGPGASVEARATQGAKVGFGVGALHGGVNSKGDLTKLDTASLKRVLLDSLFEAVPGAAGGAMVGGAMGVAEPVARGVARKLPMDMLGVSEPARRSMQRQGIYDASGDDLLDLVKPFRSGMRKGSLTEDALAELQARGENLDDVIGAIDAKTGGQTVSPDSMGVSVLRGAKPYAKGSLHDQQVAGRMGDEAESALATLGEEPISLADAEKFKQRFGPAVAKDLRRAGEPAAKTTALADTYRALKTANEAGAMNADPDLASKFMDAKADYARMAAPLEGASVERAGLGSSEFDIGDMTAAPAPSGTLGKVLESVPVAGPAAIWAGNRIGQTYGRGAAANLAEFFANRMANNSGGAVASQASSGLLQKYLDLLNEKER